MPHEHERDDDGERAWGVLRADRWFLARACARVFHGIASARFPAAEWRATPFWARHTDVSFGSVREIVAARLEHTEPTTGESSSEPAAGLGETPLPTHI